MGIDTVGGSDYFSRLNINGLINRFAFNYSDRNRESLNNFVDCQNFIDDFIVDQNTLQDFYSFAEKNGVLAESYEKEISRDIIMERITAFIARNIWNNEGFYSVLLKDDKVFEAALAYIKKNQVKNTG